jgi:hypothetical protein
MSGHAEGRQAPSRAAIQIAKHLLQRDNLAHRAGSESDRCLEELTALVEHGYSMT